MSRVIKLVLLFEASTLTQVSTYTHNTPIRRHRHTERHQLCESRKPGHFWFTAYYRLNQMVSSASHHTNHPTRQHKFSLLVMLQRMLHTLHQGPHQAIPQSSVYFHKPRGPVLEGCLATAEVMLDTPSHRNIIRPVLHFLLLSSPRRMHKDIHSGKDGRCWETTGSTMHCRMWP